MQTKTNDDDNNDKDRYESLLSAKHSSLHLSLYISWRICHTKRGNPSYFWMVFPVRLSTERRSRPRCYERKVDSYKLHKIDRKTPVSESLFQAQVFLYKLWEIFKRTIFTEHLWASASGQSNFDNQNLYLSPLQIHHVCSTLKQHGNNRFHVVSTWNTRGVLVGSLLVLMWNLGTDYMIPVYQLSVQLEHFLPYDYPMIKFFFRQKGIPQYKSGISLCRDDIFHT